jgi:hypothetical protein
MAESRFIANGTRAEADVTRTRILGCASVLTSEGYLESGCERAQIFECTAEQVLAQVEETCPQR